MATVVKVFKHIAMNPMETIEFVVPSVLFLSGLWATFYAPLGGTLAEKASDGDRMFALAFGLAHLALAVPLMYAVIHKSWSTGIKLRRWLSFVCFFLLMFYGIAGVLVNHLERISWLASFGFAVIAGVCHIRLKWDYPDA